MGFCVLSSPPPPLPTLEIDEYTQYLYGQQSQNQLSSIDDVDMNTVIHNELEEGVEDVVENLEDSEYIHNDSDKNIPYVGMKFSTDEEAYNFYNLYAKYKGFSLRKSSTVKGSCGNVIKRLFVCNKEGFKSLKDKRQIGKDVKRRAEEREGCMARMIIRRNEEGLWFIASFDDNHNHQLLSTPSKTAILRSHNKSHLLPACKNLVDQFCGVGVGPSKIARIMNATSGSPSISITPQQCIDHLRINRKNNIGRECMAMIQKLVLRMSTDYQFFYAIQIDDENVCRSVLWVDGRARTSYLQFNDVVVFDVTYRTNSFSLPFAPFTGVNHHRHCTLFGCAFLADEQEETFVWLFEKWLYCMRGKAPGAIITDQDPAICNAIKRVFPNTPHRYCSWHVSLHENEHLRSLRASYNPSFDEDYKKWVKKCRTIEEAETCWVTLKEKYQKNFEEPCTEKQKSEMKSWRWLDSMYEKRHHWIEAYLRDTFFAGMKSSQRSESMNSFFDGFVNAKTSLYDFIDQYDQATSSQRRKEEREDTICMRTRLNCTDMNELEAHAGRVYTKKVFAIFQKEFRLAVLHCRHEKVGSDGDVATFNVIFRIDGKAITHTVITNASELYFCCSCKKFETEGILCRHILYLIKQKYDMLSIPEKYILPRWTLSARYSSTGIDDSCLGRSNMQRLRELTPLQSWKLQASLAKIVEKVSIYPDMYGIYEEFEQNFWRQAQIRDDSRCPPTEIVSNQVGSTQPTAQEFISNNITIFDPAKAKTKGRPRVASRIPFGIQTSQGEAQLRTRTCSICGVKGHDMRSHAKKGGSGLQNDA